MTELDPLYVLDEDEFRMLARRVRPDITDDDFDAMWAEFQRQKNLGPAQ